MHVTHILLCLIESFVQISYRELESIFRDLQMISKYLSTAWENRKLLWCESVCPLPILLFSPCLSQTDLNIRQVNTNTVKKNAILHNENFHLKQHLVVPQYNSDHACLHICLTCRKSWIRVPEKPHTRRLPGAVCCSRSGFNTTSPPVWDQ